MITAKQMFRALVDQQLGGPGMTTAKRMQDAIQARRCRNLFFNAMAPVVFKGVEPDIIVASQTQPFGSLIIVTDILNFDEHYIFWFYPGVILQLMWIFTIGVCN